ncbi:TPA: hypothetical protein ACJ509_003659 [Stenotrophomonas maltophilia]
MTLTRKGKHWYGSEDGDIRTAIEDFSERNGYPATDYRASACACGSTLFRLFDDEAAGVARRDCVSCGKLHLMGDSAEYADEAELEAHWCLCGNESLAIHSGVALYPDSRDVRWLYIGCRCPHCQLVGVYAEWKCEAGDVEAFLARV